MNVGDLYLCFANFNDTTVVRVCPSEKGTSEVLYKGYMVHMPFHLIQSEVLWFAYFDETNRIDIFVEVDE